MRNFSSPSSAQKPQLLHPELLAHPGTAGQEAREAFAQLDLTQRESAGQEIITKLLSRGWIKKKGHRDAAKVVLGELTLTSVATAQELGLTFACALREVRDPWMRLIVGLEVSEILSRDRVCAPAATICYLQLFREFGEYYQRGEYAKAGRTKKSLFEPLALADGDRERARVIALEMVLPFAEESLRLLWSLQARALYQGDAARRKSLAAEERDLRERLSEWTADYSSHQPATHPSWLSHLIGAIATSEKGLGVKALLPQATKRSKAISAILNDCLSLLNTNKFREAFSLIDSLREGLAKNPAHEDLSTREHAVASRYVELLIRLRADDCDVSLPTTTRRGTTNPRKLWHECEAEFHEPGALWSRRLKKIRKQAIAHVPLEWIGNSEIEQG